MTTDPSFIILDPGDPRELCLRGVEVWRPIPGTAYEASNLGQIRNPKTGRIIGTGVNAQGYYVIPGMLVHRAVLSAFDGPRPPNIVGRHGPGGAKDNRLCNLAWGTRQENAADTAAQGRLRSRSGEVSPLDREAAEGVLLRVMRKEITQAEAAALLGRSSVWVGNAVRKIRCPDNTVRSGEVSLEEAIRLAEQGIEVWVTAVGPGGLEISNLGRVRRFDTKRLLKPGNDGNGYMKILHGLLHRMVMLSFSDAPFPGAVVRHTPDPNRANCALTNLKWGTYAENGEDTREHGRSRRGDSHGRSVLTDALVAEGLRLYLENRWTTAQLSDFWGGIGQGNASDIVNGKKWSHVPRPPELEGSIRRRKGGAHHLSHLTDEQVREAFVLAAQNGWGAVKLAAHLNVSVPTGSQMLSGKTWRHIPRPVEMLRSSSCASPPASQEFPVSSDLAVLVSRVRGYAAAAEEGSFRLSDDDHAIVTRDELILVTRAAGAEAVERELYPAVFDFFRAHVRRWGWFYPSSDTTLAGAVRDVQVAGASGDALSSRSKAGTGFLHARFKSFWNVDGGPVRAFAKDNLLRNVLRYRLGLNNSKDYTYKLANGEVVTTRETFDINVKNVRRGFVVQRASASFFKPAAAFHVYRRWVSPSAGDAPRVWDPSCGFGARLLGFAAAFPKGTYLGNEPASQTWEDDVRLATDLRDAGMLAGFDIVRAGSEKQTPFPPESLDLVFTSPPYFDLERYYDEPGQCWRDYPSAEAWYENYLVATFAAAFVGLKPGAHAVFNTDEKRRGAIMRAAHEVGFDLVEEMALKLGSDHFARKRGDAGPKAADERGEPIFVFRRPA